MNAKARSTSITFINLVNGLHAMNFGTVLYVDVVVVNYFVEVRYCLSLRHVFDAKQTVALRLKAFIVCRG
jgi:hypothetical protein